MRQLTLALCLALAAALAQHQANAESPGDSWTWGAKSAEESSDVGSGSKVPAGGADQPAAAAADATPRKSRGFSFPGPQSGDVKDGKTLIKYETTNFFTT